MPKGEGARKSRMLGKAIETDVASLENKKAVNTENGKSVNPDLQPDEPPVSLTIKVPLAYRQHWQIEAKKRSTTVTSLIVEALTGELGLPKE